MARTTFRIMQGDSFDDPSFTFWIPISIGALYGYDWEPDISRTEFEAVTFSELSVYVRFSDLAAVYTIYKNGSSTALSVSVPSSTTGEFADSVDSVSYSAGDDASLECAQGAGTEIDAHKTLVATYPTNSLMRVKYHGLDFTRAQNSTFYYTFGTLSSATEATAQTNFNVGGILENLYVECYANTITASSTIRSRKNAANGAMSVSIAASTTGFFQDTTNQDTIASGDDIAYQIVAGAGGTSISFNIGSDFVPTNGESFTVVTAASSRTFNSTFYYLIAGRWTITATTESNFRCYIKADCIASKLQLKILPTNTNNGTSTFRLRKNGANAALSISIGAGVSGWFEDASNSESISAGDYINYQLVTGGTSGSLLPTHATMHLYGGAQETSTLGEVVTVVDTMSKTPGRTLEEVVTVVDSIIRTPGKVLADVVTLVDTLTKSLVYSRALTEVVTVVDTVSRTVGRALSEVVTVVDSLTKSATYVRAFNEVVTVVDTISRSVGKVLVDVFTVVDTVTAKITAKVLNETVTVVDTVSRSVGRAFTEAVTVVDTLFRVTGRFLSEVFTVVDTIVSTKVTSLSLSEIVAVVDTVTAKITARVFTETVTVVDTVNRSVGRALTEVFTVVDTLAKQAGRSLVEVFTVVDSFVRNPGKALTEAVTVVDTMLRTVSRAFTETVTVVDTAVKELGRSLAESFSVTDTMTAFKGAVVLLTETVAVVDTVRRDMSRLLSETITVVDDIANEVTGIIRITLEEVITVVDTRIHAIGKFFSDSFQIEDTGGIPKITARMFTETVTVVDTIAKETGKALSDAFTVVDTFVSNFAGKAFTETIAVTDSLVRTVGKTLSESVIITDLVGLFMRAKGFILGRNKDTNTGVGVRGTPPVGKNKDTNTGIGKRLL